MSTPETNGDVEARARAWRHAAHTAVCDVIVPWAHGTIVRATRHPTYYDFNLVRVEDDPGMSVEALAATYHVPSASQYTSSFAFRSWLSTTNESTIL